MNQSELPTILARSKYKLVFLGDESVGKTSIITRFVFDTFETTYKVRADDIARETSVNLVLKCCKYSVTIGIDFVSKTLYEDDRIVRLQLWDTAGQEKFRSLIPSYIRDSSVAIVCYDITNRASFNNADQWIEDVRNERSNDVVIMLVGNKTDISDKRQVSTEEGEAKARQLGAMFVETSAKAGFNVKALFRKLAHALASLETAAPATPAADVVDIKFKTVPLNDPATPTTTNGCANC